MRHISGQRQKPKIPLLQRIGKTVDTMVGRSPARFAIIAFTSLIAVFSFLLALPVASATGNWTNPVDSLFTAVSVICVTGLATLNMATHWSPFGEVLIFIGVQIGAVGVLTLASLLGLIFAGKMGLKSKLLAASDSNPLRVRSGPISEAQAIRLGEVGSLLVTITVSTLVIECFLAVLLLPRFLEQQIEQAEAVWHSFFFSAMAFTNSGFTPNDEGVAQYSDDPWILLVLILGVFLGSLGFPVIFAFIKNFGKPHHWSLHVKLTIFVSLILLAAGTAGFMLLEFNNSRTFGDETIGGLALHSLFLSTMTRSGGFSTVDINQLNDSSLLFANMLMFVGGGSASTAGGIKVTTLAVLFLAVYSEARGKSDLEAFDRRIPHDILRVAVSVLLLSATTIAISTIVLLTMSDYGLKFVLFDVISAFGTVGLSSGYAVQASEIEKIILCLVMWMGRIGTITLSVALFSMQKPPLFRRAEERPIVG